MRTLVSSCETCCIRKELHVFNVLVLKFKIIARSGQVDLNSLINNWWDELCVTSNVNKQFQGYESVRQINLESVRCRKVSKFDFNALHKTTTSHLPCPSHCCPVSDQINHQCLNYYSNFYNWLHTLTRTSSTVVTPLDSSARFVSFICTETYCIVSQP